MYHYELGNRGIIFPLTLVVHVLLIVISPCNVLWMRITNEQKSATMVIINLKISMCRDIIANSNITKACIVNTSDSCNTDVNTPLNAIHVHLSHSTVYRDCYGLSLITICKVFTFGLLPTELLLPWRCNYTQKLTVIIKWHNLINDKGVKLTKFHFVNSSYSSSSSSSAQV